MERARSPEAKLEREQAILEAARHLATTHGIRAVTLTDIAAQVGLHKSAMLRYFETRELIFLRLAADAWREWSNALCARLARCRPGDPRAVARAFAATLVQRPLFCDLLAHVPLNLERNVSPEAVRAYKLTTRDVRVPVEAQLHRLLGLTKPQSTDVVATATSLAGALWQMANPGPVLHELYRSDPDLGHAVVEVEPRLVRVLSAVLESWNAPVGKARGRARPQTSDR